MHDGEGFSHRLNVLILAAMVAGLDLASQAWARSYLSPAGHAHSLVGGGEVLGVLAVCLCGQMRRLLSWLLVLALVVLNSALADWWLTRPLRRSW